MKIGITQRVEVIEAYGERRDCLDQSWVTLLENIGVLPVLIPNSIEDPETLFEQFNLQGFILSGGNDLVDLPGAKNAAPERDQLERTLLSFAQSRALPVMGICRGMQMINVFYGGTLVEIEGHGGTRHMITAVDGIDLFVGEIEVNSYHNYGMKKSDLADNLWSAAHGKDTSVEALVSNDRRLLGIMWHPERESPVLNSDIDIIKQHFGIIT